MVTDSEHIEALRKRLLGRKGELEGELREVQEMIRVLGDAPRMLEGKHALRDQEKVTAKPVVRYNLNLSKQVTDYIASLKYDDVVNVGSAIKTLKAEYGVQGKDSSLYAYIHSLLKKWSKDGAHQITYQKGVGFYKSRGKENPDSQLVASI